MQINDFSGGLNLRLDPTLIGKNESVVCNNIDTQFGILAPLNSKLDLTQAISKYFHWHSSSDTWLSASTKREYIDYRGKTYFTGVSEVPQVYNGTSTKNIGIVAPSVIATITITNNTQIPGTTTATQYATGSLEPGTYTYRYFARIDNGDGTFSYSTIQTVQHTITITGELRISVASVPTGSRVYIQREINNRWYSLWLAATGEDYLLTAGTTIGDRGETGIYPITDKPYIDWPRGIYTYYYTYYDPNNFIESKPQIADATGTVGSTISIDTSNFTINSNQYLRIYRQGGLFATPNRVVEIQTATAIFRDVLGEIEFDRYTYNATNPSIIIEPGIGNIILDTYNNDLPPSTLRYLIIQAATAIGSVDNRIYLSSPGELEYWPTFNYVEVEELITALAITYVGIYAFTKAKTYLFNGTTLATISLSTLSNSIGCVDHNTIAYFKNSVVWLSEEGIVTTSGGTVINLSFPRLGLMEEFKKAGSFAEASAVTLNNKYYLTFTDTDGFGTNITLVMDANDNNKFYVLTDTGDYIKTFENTLYVHNTAKLYSLLKGPAATMQITSGNLSEGSITFLKGYNEIYLSSKGNITITIYLNSIQVLEKSFNNISIKTDTILLPQLTMRGYYFTYNIVGTGTVYELSYKVVPREKA